MKHQPYFQIKIFEQKIPIKDKKASCKELDSVKYYKELISIINDKLIEFKLNSFKIFIVPLSKTSGLKP